MNGKKEKYVMKNCLILAGFFILFLSLNFVFAADPEGPDSINITSNETKSSNSGQIVNISGGYIATMNLTATVQNPRWKAFVGEVSGSFTLDDSSGSTIYDWSLSSITGRIYSTRNSSTPSWSNVDCSNITHLNQENINMNHTNPDDNLNQTFNITGTHSTFWVGSVSIPANSCPTLNTYVNNATQDSDFEEMALYDDTNIIYATIMEQDATGFNGDTYDFQMIVPEIGTPGFSGATAYYLYVEID